MSRSLTIIIYTVLIIIICKNLFKKLSNSLNQFEKSQPLNYTKPDSKILKYDLYKIIKENEKISENLISLTKTLFFKIFKLNLTPECTIFQQEMICKSAQCQICECDENEVPKIWTQPTNHGEFLNVKLDDSFNKWIDKYTINIKQWLLEEDIDSKEGSYINLLKNPEGYTGYKGAHIWNAIFKENCLSDNYNSLCKDDKFFFKLFSGWLSNTNFQIGMNFHDIVKNVNYINVTMLNERLLLQKERMENFLFLYSVIIKAVNKAKDFLLNYNYESGNKIEDKNTISLINNIFKDNSDNLKLLDDIFKETDIEIKNFLDSQKINELIIRFRNISSIIDCVTCSKCRMHAKLEVFGIGTALKILFANQLELKESVSRNELVSFINLFAKLSRNVGYIKVIDDKIDKAHFYLKFKYGGIVFGLFLFWVYAVFFDKEEEKKDDKNEKKDDNKEKKDDKNENKDDKNENKDDKNEKKDDKNEKKDDNKEKKE